MLFLAVGYLLLKKFLLILKFLTCHIKTHIPTLIISLCLKQNLGLNYISPKSYLADTKSKQI
nr:MAG TPA: hypothetical protein [Bacteriophage sp.]